jgi:hypothetical protein
MQTNRDARIRERAHQIWQNEGHGHGRHDEHWRRAEAEIDAEDKTAASVKSTKRPAAKTGPQSGEQTASAKATPSGANSADAAPAPAKKSGGANLGPAARRLSRGTSGSGEA